MRTTVPQIFNYGILAHRLAQGLGIFALPSRGFWGIVLVDWAGGFDPVVLGFAYALRSLRPWNPLASFEHERGTLAANERASPTDQVLRVHHR
jgi:hypothetical protein